MDEDDIARLTVHQQLVDALMASGQAQGLAPVLISTGISSVLLLGDEAYKLRKPVRLDFLDFSTLERRHIDCDAELALNRRTAPALYLGVVAVRGPLSSPTWEGAGGPVLDWAVRMRRFDPEQGFDRLAARGALTPAHADALGQHLGQFHQTLPASPTEHGGPDHALAWAQANFSLLQAHPLAAAWRDRLATLRHWTETQAQQLRALMACRRDQGWVREGHGDLHLGNLLWQEGRAMAFDAIEFDTSLRHADVISDFAFTWMDLHRHGLPGLAARCLNAYLETLGDMGGLPLLRWYAVYRALVRAKVALLRAAQAQSMSQPNGQDLQALAHDIATAEVLTQPPTRPMLVAMSGLSGSGKSTVALRLVERLGAIRLRSDVERKRLFGLAPLARDTAALYTADATARTYARLAQLATAVCQAGWPVVVDAANLKRAERDRWRRLAATEHVDAVLLHCDPPQAVIRQRLQDRATRGDDPSDATVSVLERQRSWAEPIGPDERPCRVSA